MSKVKLVLIYLNIFKQKCMTSQCDVLSVACDQSDIVTERGISAELVCGVATSRS